MNMKIYEAMGNIDRGLLDAHFLTKAEIARKRRAKRRSLSLLTASSAAAVLAMLGACAGVIKLYFYLQHSGYTDRDGFQISAMPEFPKDKVLTIAAVLIILSLAIAFAIFCIGKKRIERKYKIF